MRKVCGHCGANLVKRDEHYWDCSNCDNYLYVADDGREYWRAFIESTEDYDDVYDRDFCETCGSDSYPMCKGGCPYIDE